MPSMSKVSQTWKRIRGCEFSERTEIVEFCSHHFMGGTYSETTDSGTDIPQVAGADHPGFSKTTQHAANTIVQQVLNAVEVNTLEIIKKSMLGEKVDPDDINLATFNQVFKQVEILLHQYSTEADHQSFENHTQVSSTQGPVEDCKDNAAMDPFSRCEICKNLGYRLSGR